MRYLLKFRTAGLNRARLPDLPRPRGLTGFAGGLVAGTVVAAAIIAAAPAGNRAIAIVDVSQSMSQSMQDKDEREKALQKHLARLRDRGISPEIIRASGFGLSEKGSPMNLLWSLDAAIKANPSVRLVYFFSDFTCWTRDYDQNDPAGESHFIALLKNNRIQLSIEQLSEKDIPDRYFVSVVKDNFGDWFDVNGVSIPLNRARIQKTVIHGKVHDRKDLSQPVADATVFSGDSHEVKSRADGSFDLPLNDVRPGWIAITAKKLDSSTVPVHIPCQVPSDIWLEKSDNANPTMPNSADATKKRDVVNRPTRGLVGGIEGTQQH